MSKIQVKYDPQLVIPDISMPMQLPGSEQISDPNDSETATISPIKQTSIYGIICPLIAVNGQVVGYSSIIDFELDLTGHFPRVVFTYIDYQHLFRQYGDTINDNLIQVQILPPFDNAYKKINLMFYASRFTSVDEDTLKVWAEYKSPDLKNSRFTAFGEMSTYEMCDKIAQLSKIGFASNVQNTNDKRCITLKYENYMDAMSSEIDQSVADSTHVYDFWVDQWNYLNFCDLYDRYQDLDNEDDLCLWTSDMDEDYLDYDARALPNYVCFNNIPGMNTPEIRIETYDVKNNNYSFSSGTDRVITTYRMDTHEYVSDYLMDKSKTENVQLNYEYLGEVYGSYNYLFSSECRNMFMDKMKNEIIKIYTSKPSLGVKRGSQVRVIFMDANSENRYWQKTLAELGSDPESNALNGPDDKNSLGWIKDWMDAVKGIDDDSMCINLNYSGQYLVLGQVIRYRDGAWDCETLLVRPPERKPQLLTENNTDE